MPTRRIVERAKQDKRQGKSASTQAGEFVKEEMRHVRAGRHGARSTKQVIAIGLSKARRAGVRLRPPKEGTTSERTVRSAKRDLAAGARSRLALRTVRSDVVPSFGGRRRTPARRALESPMAMTCLVDRAPCLPART